VELLTWRLRVSTLWIFLAVGTLAAFFAVVMPADVLSEYLATGSFEGEAMDATMLALMVGLFVLLPLAMAFVTLALRDPFNRFANGIVGALAAVMWTWDLAEHVSKEPAISGGPVLTATLILAGLLIVWHAWKWPKPAEQDVRDRRPSSSPEQRAAGTA
jgi:hypothetical protein